MIMKPTAKGIGISNNVPWLDKSCPTEGRGTQLVYSTFAEAKLCNSLRLSNFFSILTLLIAMRKAVIQCGKQSLTLRPGRGEKWLHTSKAQRAGLFAATGQLHSCEWSRWWLPPHLLYFPVSAHTESLNYTV